MRLKVKQKKYGSHSSPRFNVEVEVAGEVVFGVGPYPTREQARREGEAAFLAHCLKSRIGDGASGQDRESYSDDQDRESYAVTHEATENREDEPPITDADGTIVSAPCDECGKETHHMDLCGISGNEDGRFCPSCRSKA